MSMILRGFLRLPRHFRLLLCDCLVLSLFVFCGKRNKERNFISSFVGGDFWQPLIGHVRYINILTWLRGFQVKLLYLVLFSLYLSLFWELRDKRNLKNLQFWPESPGAMLEYWYIERGLFVTYLCVAFELRTRKTNAILCTYCYAFLGHLTTGGR